LKPLASAAKLKARRGCHAAVGLQHSRCRRCPEQKLFWLARVRSSWKAYWLLMIQQLNEPTSASWQPDSWQQKVAAQQPTYPDQEALQAALFQLSRLPPLVTSWEVESLKRQLAEAQHGERFLLQGGDCSESFHRL